MHLKNVELSSVLIKSNSPGHALDPSGLSNRKLSMATTPIFPRVSIFSATNAKLVVPAGKINSSDRHRRDDVGVGDVSVEKGQTLGVNFEIEKKFQADTNSLLSTQALTRIDWVPS